MTAAPLAMLDLCSGFGGASQAMKDRGWRVLRVDRYIWRGMFATVLALTGEGK